MGRLLLILAFTLGIAPAVLRAADPDETYHERLEYDAKTGQWVAVAPPIPGTDGGDLAIARGRLARDDTDGARKAFKDWFKTYTESDLWPEALLYAAETEIAAEDAKPRDGDIMQAYKWLEELLEGYPGTTYAERAVRKEIIIAEMILFKDRKQKVLKGTFWLSAKEEALQMLDRIIDDWAVGTPVAEQALRLKADYHYAAGEFDEAEIAYTRLMREFPRGRYQMISLLRAGESALARFPGVRFDDADLLEAEVYLGDFQNKYPQAAAENMVPQLLSRINESKANKEFTIAEFYERTKSYDAAIYYYRLVERNYPATTWAAEAKEKLIILGAEEPPSYETITWAPEPASRSDSNNKGSSGSVATSSVNE